MSGTHKPNTPSPADPGRRPFVACIGAPSLIRSLEQAAWEDLADLLALADGDAGSTGMLRAASIVALALRADDGREDLSQPAWAATPLLALSAEIRRLCASGDTATAVRLARAMRADADWNPAGLGIRARRLEPSVSPQHGAPPNRSVRWAVSWAAVTDPVEAREGLGVQCSARVMLTAGQWFPAEAVEPAPAETAMAEAVVSEALDKAAAATRPLPPLSLYDEALEQALRSAAERMLSARPGPHPKSLDKKGGAL